MVDLGRVEIDEGMRESVMTVLAERGLTVPEARRISPTHLGTDPDFANGGPSWQPLVEDRVLER